MKPHEQIKQRITKEFNGEAAIRAHKIFNAFSHVVREDQLENYLFVAVAASFNNQTPMAYGTENDAQCQRVVDAARRLETGEPA